MRIRGWMKFGGWLGAGASMTLGAVALVFAACSSTKPPPPPATGGGACSTEAGAFPTANCDDTPETCTAPNPSCATTPCSTTSPCLAMSENSGQATDSLRIRKLNITAPPVLIGQVGNPSFIQKTVIDQAVNLNHACGEAGDGSFSWLLKFDMAKKTLTTGGAPPTTDPFNIGYCFVNAQISGLPVAPVTSPITQAVDGSWSTGVVDKLYVPIYVHGSSTNVVILPLTKATLRAVTLSMDGDCIGSYNPDGVPTSAQTGGACLDQDPSSCQRWHTAGSLGGFITLNEADAVFIVDLNRSLCVELTGGTSLAPGDSQHCAKDSNGNVTGKGRLLLAGQTNRVGAKT